MRSFKVWRDDVHGGEDSAVDYDANGPEEAAEMLAEDEDSEARDEYIMATVGVPVSVRDEKGIVYRYSIQAEAVINFHVYDRDDT